MCSDSSCKKVPLPGASYLPRQSISSRACGHEKMTFLQIQSLGSAGMLLSGHRARGIEREWEEKGQLGPSRGLGNEGFSLRLGSPQAELGQMCPWQSRQGLGNSEPCGQSPANKGSGWPPPFQGQVVLHQSLPPKKGSTNPSPPPSTEKQEEVLLTVVQVVGLNDLL